MSGAVLIPLHGADGCVRDYAVVDAEDAERLNHRRWAWNAGYAQRDAMIGSRRVRIGMHREVLRLALDNPREVDHLNGDRLDNRKINLRAVTHAENIGNQRAQQGRSSRFRGVIRSGDKWCARVKRDGRTKQLGTFKIEEDAGRAVEAWWQANLPHLAEGVPPRISREGLPVMVPPSKNAHAIRSTNPSDLIDGVDEYGAYVGIPLYGRSDTVIAHALVDPWYAERLSKSRWFANVVKTPRAVHIYAVRSVRDGHRWLQIPMYADVLELTEAGAVCQVRRVNGNNLDNRRANLRVLPTKGENSRKRAS